MKIRRLIMHAKLLYYWATAPQWKRDAISRLVEQTAVTKSLLPDELVSELRAMFPVDEQDDEHGL